ncbi:MAG: Crp/Fnr family transcriptional regulator [Vibrio gallaecicus]|uniref:Crp/Fnr family transcriptional regulator n=1 Tax=Vibrio gallaecicus TaxID=552386 RepID=A0ABV4N9X4_9VIBR|nr:Crp/Fnr family transcriptional regulator [Vibrio gallaecicus]MDN3614743.1 Crp/Fnr family transcriptional regulator [Vibrio gallaecicus]
MQLRPYANTRFTPLLEQQYGDFEAALFQCRVGTQRFSRGDTILEQGQPVNKLYIISVGRVAMHICAVNSRRFQLGEVKCDHHIFGEMEFFSGNACQWNVVADDDIEADVICANQLQKCITDKPNLALFFASALAYDYEESMEIYTNRVLHSIAYNIAYDLWHRARQNVFLDAFDKVEFEAERFGTSSRVYRRALNTLIEQGLIEKRGNQIHICDMARLEAFIS